jgi:hypothetical protein
MMQFDNYRRSAKTLRALIKTEFASTRPSTWRYRYTDLLPICEIRGLNNRPPPPNAVAYVLFNSKYCSSENPGWRLHSEHVYLINDGTFVSDGYDRVLTAVLPGWLQSVTQTAQIGQSA